MKPAVLLCLGFATLPALAGPPAHRPVFREYRIGPVLSKGPVPTLDVLKELPDSVAEVRRRIGRRPDLDTNAIRKLDTGIHIESEGLIRQTGPYYSLTLRGKTVSSRILGIHVVRGPGKEFLLSLRVQEEGKRESFKLIGKEGISDWDPDAHGRTFPLPMQDGWVTVDTLGRMRSADDTAHFAIRKNGRDLYRFQTCDPVRDPILGFYAWEGKWVLQLQDRLIVDGKDIRIGSAEVFNGRPFADGLFYLAKTKGGPVRAYWQGAPLGRPYDFVPHDLCCGNAVENVVNGETSIGFFGARKGTWYLAVVASR